MPDHADAIAATLASALGTEVRILSLRGLGGGDISVVERVVTSVGAFVVKSHASAPGGFFRAEAAGLAALGSSGTSLRVPAVGAVRDEAPALIVLEDLGHGDRFPRFDDAFGRGLAELHGHGAAKYGFDVDTFCGLTRQPNAWADSWVAFYGQARLGHQVSLARHAGLLTTSDATRLERLIARLDTLIDEPAEGPVLIHGDLWSGNLHMASDDAPALIDPSCYFAHREAEFGMMTLFGGFSARAYEAYNEVLRLEPGWRERTPIYQLYHLLNHLNLFGGGYHSQVMAIAKRFA
jgi:protein-ribulosamine 3-kinase